MNTPRPMNDDERIVWWILNSRHQGQAHATTNEKLTKSTSIPLRRLRAIVERLVRDYHLPISSHPSVGIWVAVNEAEREMGLKAARRHALSALGRYRGLKLSHIQQQVQGDLFGTV